MADQASGILSPWLREKRIAAALPYIKGKILDYGCGIGVLAELVPAASYFGVDRDEESLLIARTKYPLARFASRVPENELFDTIVLLAVIEHIAEPEGFLQGLHPILEPNGSVVITTPHPIAERIHAFGAKLGFFSASAHEEHEQLYDSSRMQDLARRPGFVVCEYKRFLFGVNQLFILKRK